jgi:hypothetical protein
MKKLFLVASAMAVLVFSACKKDKDSGPDDNNGGNNGKLLKKVTKEENGTTTTYNVVYDANKRLSSYNSSDNSETTVFTYDNAGNVTKVEIKEENYYNTLTYTYNNGIPVSGNIKIVQKTAGEPDDVQQDETLTYTVVNNQVTKIHHKDNLEDDVEYDVALTYQPNGNLAKAALTGEEEYSVVYTYGNKKPAFPTLSKWVLDLGFSIEFASKNELITTFMDFPGTQFDMTYTSQYTYDAAGFPLTSTMDGTVLKYEYQ